MNDNYPFEDKMRSLLGEERKHRYDPQQWQRLSRRLREYDQPPVMIWQRFMPVGLAALLLLLGWQIWEQHSLQRTVMTLSEQLTEARQLAAGKQNNTVVVYDTIFRKVVVGISDQGGSPSAGRADLPYNALRPGSAWRSFSRLPRFEPRFSSGSALSTADFTESVQQEYQRFRGRHAAEISEGAILLEKSSPPYITELLPYPSLSSLRFFGSPPPLITAVEVVPNTLPGPSLWQRIKPKGYQISGGVGGFRSWDYGNDEGDWFGDLNVEFMLGERWSLDLGAAYFQRTFEVDGEDLALPSDLPAVTPNDEGDELEEINGRIRQLQFPVGIRYYFVQRSRLSSYFGFGVAPTLGVPSSTINYRFEDDDDEHYVLSAGRVVTTDLQTPALYGSLGLQTELGKRWQVGLAITAQQPLGSYAFEYQRPAWGRWRLGVGYRL